ncbi:hypothetical protein FLJC2902T_00620 [Flavobacterium limnosediminis JC2902]|uniref:Uncharacterized protein n=1 Tax=Flavobacterium limnosediminis JC2902 TaxID=1341181 RepID=V6SSB1_9FLAO|nr:hypothetical protein FLJC2902T_00620 [Flavobacterium limnosediminis JC2902]
MGCGINGNAFWAKPTLVSISRKSATILGIVNRVVVLVNLVK